MTKQESEYIERLRDRLRMLYVRLNATPETAAFRVDIKKEINALSWAVRKLDNLRDTEETV